MSEFGYEAISNVLRSGWSVDHIQLPGCTIDHTQLPGRTVSVRRGESVDGLRTVDLVFQHYDGDRLRCHEYKWSVPAKQATRLIRTFLRGEQGDKHEPDLFINQAVRECTVVKTTPTRVRIEYEMPNAGLMGGWQYYVDLGDVRYYSYY